MKHVKNEARVVAKIDNAGSKADQVRALQAQVVALQRALLFSQRENVRLKADAERSAVLSSGRPLDKNVVSVLRHAFTFGRCEGAAKQRGSLRKLRIS